MEAACRDVLHRSEDLTQRYRAGESKVLRHLVGQVMKQTSGRADAAFVTEYMKQEIERGDGL